MQDDRDQLVKRMRKLEDRLALLRESLATSHASEHWHIQSNIDHVKDHLTETRTQLRIMGVK